MAHDRDLDAQTSAFVRRGPAPPAFAVNPIVAISIGVGLLHERFDWHLAVGAAIILAGVAAMIVGRAKKPVGTPPGSIVLTI